MATGRFHDSAYMEFKLTVVAESGFWLYSRSLPTVPLPSGALSRKSITTDSFLNGQLGLLREVVVELGCKMILNLIEVFNRKMQLDATDLCMDKFSC